MVISNAQATYISDPKFHTKHISHADGASLRVPSQSDFPYSLHLIALHPHRLRSVLLHQSSEFYGVYSKFYADEDRFVPRQAPSINAPLGSGAQPPSKSPSSQGTAPPGTLVTRALSWSGTAPASVSSVLTSSTVVGYDVYNSSRQTAFTSFSQTTASIIRPSSITQNSSVTTSSGISLSSSVSVQPELSSVVTSISPTPPDSTSSVYPSLSVPPSSPGVSVSSKPVLNTPEISTITSSIVVTATVTASNVEPSTVVVTTTSQPDISNGAVMSSSQLPRTSTPAAAIPADSSVEVVIDNVAYHLPSPDEGAVEVMLLDGSIAQLMANQVMIGSQSVTIPSDLSSSTELPGGITARPGEATKPVSYTHL